MEPVAINTSSKSGTLPPTRPVLPPYGISENSLLIQCMNCKQQAQHMEVEGQTEVPDDYEHAAIC